MPLARVLAVEDGPLAITAAQALGASGSPAAEAPLVRALAQSASDVAAAAAEALGSVGSAAAVLALKEAADSTGASTGLRRAARQAVAEIQSRLQGASPGQVSLAEGEAGQLSLAGEDPVGRVTLADQRSDPRLGGPAR
jgi:HEAT repeat protein